MADPSAPKPPDRDKNPVTAVPELLLDQIDALRVLRADTDVEKGRLLEQIGGKGVVEQDIVRQMSAVRPLHHPDRFEEAHRLMMRGIEILDRNGPRPAAITHIGPLRPVGQWLVQLVSRWIVRSHLNRLMSNLCSLYEKREANSAWGSPEHSMLRRARLDARRVQAGMNRQTIGLPAFLVGGAFITSIASALQSAARSALDSTAGVVVLAVILMIVLIALSWVALYSAGVSRRRIRLSTDQPIKALWETIGATGRPPRDESYNFAVYAIVLLVLSWIVVPLAIWLAIRA